MVSKIAQAAGRLAGAVSDDLRRFQAQLYALRPASSCQAGLHTYRISTPQGQMRLHLRIHGDYTGLLLINGQEAVHLTPTAAHMAKLALDEVPTASVLAALGRSYPDVARDRLREDLAQITQMVATLRQPTSVCSLCQIDTEKTGLYSIRAQAPYKADLAVHYACNNNCSHCYNEPGRRSMPSLPLADWKRILRKLFDIGVPYVIFTGGEPTLHPSILDLISYADNLGQIAGMNSNGRRLADADFVTGLKESGLDHVQITLNSHRPEVHNQIVGAEAYNETIRGLRNALAAGLHTITNTTLTQANGDEALEMVDFLCGLGVHTFAMNGMIHSGCGMRHEGTLTESQLHPLLEKVKERAAEYGMRFLWYTPTEYCRLSPIELGLGPRTCNAAEYSICIEPNGDVLPCQSYYEPAGNILHDPWDEIWNSELFRSFRYRREEPQAAGLPEKCWNCELLHVCGGGCRLERQARVTEVN